MKDTFVQGEFSRYSNIRLDEARSSIRHSQYGLSKTTVFISHKHDDLDDLKGVIGLLQQKYGVLVYIDSQDPTMPKITSAETASNIKDRICECDKFILLATNGAIESKWCNWELGYGDAKKFEDNIALFPIRPNNTYNSYKGSEYMDIYPYIYYSKGTELYSNGRIIPCGFYVCKHRKYGDIIIPLDKWFNQR